ncbi:MAG: hypothetical protein IT428_25495 [Planctomycetaceae bacterium]|nr:hypothetical protein [Planctomycetaceae bacterium]
MSGGLEGAYHVKPVAAAIRDAQDLFPKYGDYQEARRHALKLRFWPSGMSEERGTVVDLDWEWIKAMIGEKVGELRIDDQIAGQNNLRIIFYVSDIILPNEPLPKIWLLSILQKKSWDFTKNDLRTFRTRLAVLKLRTYGPHN